MYDDDTVTRRWIAIGEQEVRAEAQRGLWNDWLRWVARSDRVL